MSQRGAFILNSVGHKQLTTIVQKYTAGTGTNTSTYYIPIANSWESAGAIGTYGWFAGGFSSPTASVRNEVDRIDFANDSPTTALARPSAIYSKTRPGAAGNANYGWFAATAGGAGANPASWIERIDYSNDAGSPSVRGFLNGNTGDLAGTSNANYGWFGGGYTNPVIYYSTVQRLDFSNDLVLASYRGPLLAARRTLAATGNANYGWFSGGLNGPIPTLVYLSIVDRIDYSNDSPSASSPRGLLNTANQGLAGISNTNYGWFGGGTTGPTTTSVSTVNRIDFSNDSPTAASPRGPLSKVGVASAAGNANYGWFGGGYTAPSVPVSTVDRIDFSNDSPSAASIRGPLSIARGSAGAVSNYVKALPNFVGVGSVSTGTFGVFGTPSSVNTATGIAQIGGTFGWNGGGTSAATSSIVDRIDFANDSPTTASPRGPLNTARDFLAATGNANYAWFAGGFAPGPSIFSTINRIDYANDSPTASSPRGLLSAARYRHAATGNANYGWFAGGVGPLSTVNRIDYSNDSPTSASFRGPLRLALSQLSATGNANYGWFGGGYAPALTSTFDRIDFANDSPTSTTARGTLAVGRVQMAATGNQNYGWFGGGYISPGVSSVVDRIDFANDSPTTASPRGPLSLAKRVLAATSNANYGWFTGGLNPVGVVISTIDRVDFASDSPTAAGIRGPLSSIRNIHAATSNYVNYPIDPRSGGLNVNLYAATTASNTASGVTIYNGTFGWVSGTASSVNRIDFATDSATASVRGPLSLARMLGSTTHNTQYGWFIGGLQPASPYARYSTVDRIDYANDSPTAATVRGNLSIAKAQHTSMGNINYGWIAGGETVLGTSSLFSSVDRIDYSNESPASSSPRGPLTAARGYMDATANEYYGWVAGGGFTVSPTAYSTVERIDFANDSPTAAASRSRLQTATYEIAGAGNRNYGWFNRGGASTSLVERLDYSNDTVNTLLRGSLSQVRSKHSAASNSSYGWWIGGFVTPNPVSTVDRIDFSNDSPTASAARGPLAATRYGTASASNYVTTLLTGFVVPQYKQASAGVGTGAGTYGWFAGGTVLPAVTTVSTVDRIDFSNDSPTSASPRGPLATARSLLAATGNANYGWFGAGPSSVSTVERIDFGNDSPTSASPRGPLSVGRSFPGATGNASYGWFAGGGVGSIVDRIDFANDGITASLRGPLSAARSNHAATGNANYGWFGGGGGPVSTVDRIDFSNDSPTAASRRGLLSSARRNLSATGNIYYGWFGGGNPGGGAVSTVDRIDFANDSPTTASARGLLSAARYSLAASGNANYGWFSSGSNPAIVTAVDRIDFSNDSPTIASARGLLSAARYNLASSSNYVK